MPNDNPDSQTVTTDSITANVLSIVIGPLALVPGLIMILPVALVVEGRWLNVLETLAGLFMMSLFGLAIAYPAALFYGLPVMIILRRLGLFSPYYLVPLSLVPCTLFFINSPFEFYAWSFFAWSSASVAMGCWAVMTYHERR